VKNDHISEKMKRRIRLEDIPVSCNLGLAGSQPSLYQNGSFMARFLSTKKLSKKTFLALLQLCIEIQLLDWTTDNEVATCKQLPSAEFKNAAYIYCLFDLFHRFLKCQQDCTSDGISSISSILQDIYVILSSRGGGGGNVIRQIPHWQLLLIELLPTEDDFNKLNNILTSCLANDDDRESNSMNSAQLKSSSLDLVAEYRDESKRRMSVTSIYPKQELEILHQRVLKILTYLLLELFDTDRRAWKLIEEATLLVWLSRKFGSKTSGIVTIRKVLISALHNIQAELSNGDAGVFVGKKMVRELFDLLFLH
jgi:hypothetical protein